MTLVSPGSKKMEGGQEGQPGETLNSFPCNEGWGAKTPQPDFAAICHSWEENPNLILLEAGLSGVTP